MAPKKNKKILIMGMSNAERQRRFRERRDADHEKRQAYIQKGRERYQNDCKNGKIVPVSNLTEREKRSIRKRWRKQKQKDRIRMKKTLDTLETLNTPPSTPEYDNHSSRQKKQHHKKSKREIAKAYRDKKKMELEIENLKKKVEMFKKRISRKQSNNRKKQPDTPRSRTRNLLRNLAPKEVKRSLFSYQVLIEAIRQKYKEKRKKEKSSFATMICNQTLKKYRIKSKTYSQIGQNTRRNPSTTGYDSLTKRVSEKVHAFYRRNDNSRLITGKKQTKTHKKIRKQRRLLLSNLKTLHKKLLSEGKTKVSYSVFCRLRPFYVVFPRPSDRNTCLCKICNNTELMAEALTQIKATKSADLSMNIEEVACSINEKKCMYGECEECKDRTVNVNKDVLDKDITWFEWVTNKEVRTIKKAKCVTEKPVYVTVKECKEGNVADLFDKFCSQLKRYQKHIFRTNTQYDYYNRRRTTLSDNECIMHIDFSENYVCGYNSEIQSVHFGASKKQISLQTGVTYMHNNSPQTFCTVSDSLVHGPEGVWGHLKPVLTDIKKKHPNISNIEIFSDGPVTQYRQKGNFYLASTKGKELGFEKVAWSFFEAGHGKGIPDAIGGALKRQADNAIKYGCNITSAGSFCNAIPKESNVNIYLVSEESIIEIREELDKVTLKAIPGTFNLHQVICDIKDGMIAFRHLSCECAESNEHEGHAYELAAIENKTGQNKIRDENNNVTDKIHGNEDDIKIDIKATENVEKVLSPSVKSKRQSKLGTGNRKIKTPKESLKMTKRKQVIQIDFEQILEDLETCRTTNELRNQVKRVPETEIKIENICLQKNKLDIDYHAIKDMPNDVKNPQSVDQLIPVEVNTDGNCLPSCGSVFAFGTPDRSEEMRARIVKELTIHENLYLDDGYLQNGMPSDYIGRITSIKSQFAQYSEFFIPGMTLTQNIIRDIYRKEVLSITENKSFMGIWQIFALASILKCPIYSVYPIKGNASVRNDLNRIIMPRLQQDSNPVHILWTNTRDDIPNEHWVPNHFVALISVGKRSEGDNQQCTSKKENDQRKDTTNDVRNINNDYSNTDNETETNPTKSDKKQISEKIQNQDSEKQSYRNLDKSQCKMKDLKMEEGRTEWAEVEIKIGDDINGVEESCVAVNDTDNKVKCDAKCEIPERYKDMFVVPEIQDCLNKYVIVRFNGKPYPGYVQDIDNCEVEVLCMHQVGKRNTNCFFWPRKIKDLSWYNFTDIMTIIPNPTPIENTRHHAICEKLWEHAINACK